MLVGRSKLPKQIIQIKHNRVKNPNWPEANQLAIYKRGRGFELGTTENKSSKRSGRDLNPRPPNCKSSALTARPRCLHRPNTSLWPSSPIASSFSSPSSSSSSGHDYFSNMSKAADFFILLSPRKMRLSFFPFLIIYVK